MEKNDFLKNLQESVESGEKNDDIVNHLNEIDKKASNVTPTMSKNLEKQFAKVKPEIDEKEREKAEEEYLKLMVEQEENDEKLRFLANIESRNNEIRKMKEEFESVKLGYSKKIETLHKEKINLMVEYEKKYEKKAEDEYDFTPEIDRNLD